MRDFRKQFQALRLLCFVLFPVGLIDAADLKEQSSLFLSPSFFRSSDFRLSEQENSEPEDQTSADPFQWKTMAGRYISPGSLFSLHGYVEGVFGASSKDWTSPDPSQIGPPGQLLVPNTSNASFAYDAALFFGSEITSSTQLLLELHLVSDPGGQGAAGPGGLTIALTEASASWAIFESALTLSGGIFWAPFGAINQDWLGAENLFTLIPRATGAFPAHFNERGIRLNGAFALAKNSGLNYVFTVGNGVQSFDISGQNSFDPNQNKTIMGRIGVFPGLANKLEIGYSFATGTLRDREDTAREPEDSLRYPADMTAHAIDLHWRHPRFTLRSYFLYSNESLDSFAVSQFALPDITRNGFLAEISYPLVLKNSISKRIGAITPKFRYDWIDGEQLNAENPASTNRFQTSVYSVGFNLYPAGNFEYDSFLLSFEYHFQDELEGQELSNDRFVFRITAKY